MADIKLGNLLYKDNTAPVDDTNPVSTKDEQAKDKLDELKSELQSVDGKVATETTLEQIDQRLQTLEDTVEDGLQKVTLNGNIVELETAFDAVTVEPSGSTDDYNFEMDGADEIWYIIQCDGQYRAESSPGSWAISSARFRGLYPTRNEEEGRNDDVEPHRSLAVMSSVGFQSDHTEYNDFETAYKNRMRGTGEIRVRAQNTGEETMTLTIQILKIGR